MSIDWSEDLDAVDWEELAAMYRAAPLGNKDPQALRLAFSNSRYRFIVREHGHIVGAGRVLSDGVDVAYVADIAFLPSHQGRGLGKEMIRRLLEPVRGHKKILLYAKPGVEDFYRGFGFRRMATAMIIFENPEAAQANGYLAD